MAGGALFDGDEVQTGFHVARHFAVEKIQDDFASRRGLPIPRADRRGRHHDNNGQARLRGFERFLLGHPLGALVVADHFFQAGVSEFVGMLRTVHGDCGDGAGVDELLDPGAHGSVQKIFRATYVGIVNVLFAPGPQAVVSGDMEDALGSLHGARDRSCVAQIAGDILKGQIRDGAIGARRAHDHAHVFAARHELSRYVAPQEARSARDQRSHAISTPSSCTSAGELSASGAEVTRDSRPWVCDRSASSTCFEN